MNIKKIFLPLLIAAALTADGYRGPAARADAGPFGFAGSRRDDNGAILAGTVKKRPRPSKTSLVTVLFFNDLHGNLQPFNVTEDGKQIEVGGIARMAYLAGQIREENKKKSARTFLLVAGDILQGTPMSTVFQGRPDVECLNAMGVTAMTIGNHEFDFGLDNLLELKKTARFQFISSNIIRKDTGELFADPAISLDLGNGVTLSVIGATTGELLTTTAPANVEKISVLDPVMSVKKEYDKRIKNGPVILLSHSKFQTDYEIATAMPGLLAIIGGHDQILFDPCKKAAGVPVFQAFEKGRYLGRLDIVVNAGTKKARVEKWMYYPITPGLKKDAAVDAIITGYQSRMAEKFREVIGQTKVFLDAERERIRYEETNLGNFVSDVMRERTGADIALINAGALRSSVNAGRITIEDVFKVMPYPNEVIVVRLTGTEIAEVLKRSAQGAKADEDGGFLHVSGLRFKIDGKTPVDVFTVQSNAALDPSGTYSVAITDFMASGGDGYTTFSGKQSYKTGSPLRELLVDAIKKKSEINPVKEGRITRIK